MNDLNDCEYYTKQKHRFYAIPLELTYDAHRYAVSIGDTCIEALRRAIQAKKARLYGSSCRKDCI